ncbi:hypothetical protein Hanom_Chr01g00046201 [Helianthus anomalus]
MRGGGSAYHRRRSSERGGVGLCNRGKGSGGEMNDVVFKVCVCVMLNFER